MVDHIEGAKWAFLKQNRCLYCCSALEDLSSLINRAPLRDMKRTFYQYDLAQEALENNQRRLAAQIMDDMDMHNDLFVEPLFRGWKFSNIYQAVSLPDLLHKMISGLFGDHILNTFMMSIFTRLEGIDRRYRAVKGEFSRRFGRVNPFPDLKIFHRGYLKLQQLNGKDVKNIVKVIIPVMMQLFPGDVELPGVDFDGFIESTRILVEVYYIVSSSSISDELLDYLEGNLTRLDEIKETFQSLSPSRLEFVKWHSLQHLVELIKSHGMPVNYSTEAFERAHRRLKDAYKAVCT